MNLRTRAAALALVVCTFGFVSPAVAGPIVFDSIPNPLPPNLDSLGYQATSTYQFGDIVDLVGSGSRSLETFTFALSNWALHSDYPTVGTAAGYNQNFTLNLYNVAAGNTVGGLLGTFNTTALVPWRPAADPTCPGGTAYRAGNGNCYSGSLSTVTINLLGLLVPDQFIYGLALNTQTYGASPTGVAGPYNSLNFAVSDVAPFVGSDPLPGSVYWNTSACGFYTDGGAGGCNVFRQDTNWTPYTPAVEITALAAVPALDAVPEPATIGMFALGLAAVSVQLRRRRNTRS